MIVGGGKLLLQEFKLGAREHEIGGRGVEIELRAGLRLDQRCLALHIALLQVDALFGEVEHLRVDFHIVAQVIVTGPRGFESSLGLLEREAERHWIDLEQFVAGLDLLAFLDENFLNLA